MLHCPPSRSGTPRARLSTYAWVQAHMPQPGPDVVPMPPSPHPVPPAPPQPPEVTEPALPEEDPPVIDPVSSRLPRRAGHGV